MTKIIFINGPKRSGKDTAGGALFVNGLAKMYKMTTPMDDALRAFFGFTHAEYKVWREERKDDPTFMGTRIFRHVMIDFSERFIKPTIGENAFGLMAVQRIEAMKTGGSGLDAVCITDSGFADEATPLIEKYGADNCLLIRLYRDGHTFAGDSRDYIDLPNVKRIDVYNNFTEELFKQMIVAVVEEWLHPQQN